MRIAILFFVLGLVAVAAEESPGPSPSPSPARSRQVLLRFALPPLDGTISLGIFDRTGKLVRTLHRALQKRSTERAELNTAR